MIFLEEDFTEGEYRSALAVAECRDSGPDCGRQEGGKFGPGNKCQEDAGSGGSDSSGSVATASPASESAARAPKLRNVDVMLGGGKHTAVIDSEIRARANEDSLANPKPEGSHPGSATDLWDRTFVRRAGETKTRITLSDPVFPPDRYTQGGSYVAHEDIGQYLSLRHENDRRSLGDTTGPTAIIDTTLPLPQQHFDYMAGALADDAVHAYEVGGFDPGFYSSDLKEAMSKMATLHPEIETDQNARFVFTMLTAITSNGQDPNTNLVDADGLYEMYKKHGTVVPAKGQDVGPKEGDDGDQPSGDDDEESAGVGGARDVGKSLRLFQSMLDSFGVDRTRRLLSGYTTVERVNRALVSISDKSGDPDWQKQTGSSPWMVDHFADRTQDGRPKAIKNLVKQSGPRAKSGSGEFSDEVVPVAAIFGPKIGSFYANLSGRHDFLTMDRWLMRSVGRVTGELITRSTPESAKKSAATALAALETSRSSQILFGLNKPPHNLTKADIVRSLKIQSRTGVVEEHGAAFLWATAAANSYKKTPRAGGGGFGKHPDPAVDASHKSGNAIFKSLIKEQQTPRGPQARRNIREVFREIVSRIEERYPDRKGKVDVDEVQAVLWQYEKNLWKHLGGRVVIEKNSLYSKAADKLLARGSRKALKPEKRAASRKSWLKAIFGTDRFGAEQNYWNDEIEQSGIDFNDVFLALEEDEDEESRAFCPTGEDGGIDNSCGGDKGGGSEPKATSDKPSGGSPKAYTPDPTHDSDGDGVTDAARVGVPAFDVPPPPKIGRLPGLDQHGSAVQDAFISHYESDPDKVASQFLDVVTKSGEPPTFGTDDAKCLTDAWSDPDPEKRAENRATLNCALHQTANAIAKRSFLQHLDTLSKGDEIMVTVGGCGAGKGFALKHDATALEAKGRAKAVWDSAGDQNATESPWILKEAEDRGLKVTFVYVHADPKTQWADPNRGVVKRASDPKDGRMVDAKVFADSYAIGARNHHAFHQANKDNPSARFIFLDNTGKPKQIAGVPEEALRLDADELAKFASEAVSKADVPPRVKAGGTIGERIWGGKKKK